jgi:YVTN family beta-propeller protein
MSVLLVACNNVSAQTRDFIMEQRKVFENNPQIIVGNQPSPGIGINEETNKVYITNSKSGTVSVVDSNSGSAPKTIRVGESPGSIAVDSDHNKIYVARVYLATEGREFSFNQLCNKAHKYATKNGVLLKKERFHIQKLKRAMK